MTERRRLSDAALTPGQTAAAEARRLARQTPEYQEGLARDVAAYREEYPPSGTGAVPDDLRVLLMSLAAVRASQGLSLTELSERTGIDRGTLSKLENGKFANPTLKTLRAIAGAMGMRLSLSLAASE